MSVRNFAVRRWPWILGAAALGVAIAIPLRIRSRGLARYAAVKAAVLAGGGGLEEFLREAPPVDPGLQARWRRLTDRAVASRIGSTPYRWKVADWLNGGGPEPEGARALYDADAEIRAEASLLLAEGIPLAGAYGWWVAGGGGPVLVPGSARIENLLGVKNLANLLFLQAAMEQDPGPALETLDRMHGVFARPGTLIDAMIGTAVAEIRDETYARLAAVRRLPRAAGERWLSEAPSEPGRVAFAIRGERLLYFEPVAEIVVSGSFSGARLGGPTGAPTGPFDWLRGGGRASGWWLHGAEACARVLEHYAGVEQGIREGTGIPDLPGEGDAAGRLTESLTPNSRAIVSNALGARQRHRVARAFVRALEDPVERLLPPGGPGELPIVVELPQPGRLRVRSDPTGPLPPAWRGIEPPRQPEPEKGPPRPFLWRAAWIEADLPPAVR